MMPNLPPNVVAKWVAPTSNEKNRPAYECGPCSTETKYQVGMDQAGLAQNGPVLIARSGSCLLMPIYAAFSKIGALIHLWRNEYLWDEQRSLIRDVFVRFPELSDRPTVGLVSSPKLRDENQLQLEQAHALILSLAPIARFVEILVGSEPQEHTDPEL